MLTLMRRDPLLGSPGAILRMLAMLLLGTSVAEGVRVFAATASDGTIPGLYANRLYVAAALWLAPVILALLAKSRERCRPMDLALPIDARRLWLAHALTVWLLGLVLLAAGAGIIRAHAAAVAAIPGKIPVPAHGLEFLMFPLAASLSLVVAALQSYRPGLQQVPADKAYRSFAVEVLLGGLGLALALSLLPWSVALLPLAFALALTARTYHSLPPGLVVLPREPEPAPEASQNAVMPACEQTAGTESRDRWYALRLIHRILMSKKIPAWIFYLFLMGWGLFASGFLLAWSDWDEGAQLGYVFLTAYLLFSFAWAPMTQLHLVDHLPIPRRHLFALMTVPFLFALLLGYGAGRIGLAYVESERPLIAYDRTPWPRLFPPYLGEYPLLRVPGEVCRIAWDGQPPDITAPWGESHKALGFPLFKGSRAVIYSPFHTAKGCSEDFAVWQTGRAIEEVYGPAMALEEVKGRYLAGGGIVLPQDQTVVRSHRRVTIAPIVILSTGLLWTILLISLLRAHRATVSATTRKIVFIGLLVLTLALHLAFIAAYLTRTVRTWIFGAFLEISLRRILDPLPAGYLLLWLAVALAFWGAFWIARSQFQKIEIPVQRG